MKKILKVEAMHCQHCVKSIEEALEALSEVEKVSADLQTKEVTVEGAALEESTLVDAVESIGFDVDEVR